MRNTLFFLLLSPIMLNAYGQPDNLKIGDILFLEMDCGEFCEAINKVTDGYGGRDFAHCGLLAQDAEGNLTVIEAVQDGVQEIPLSKFLQKERIGDVLVGRVQTLNDQQIAQAVKEAKAFVGLPYDHVFELGDAAFYCSELVYEAYKRGNQQREVFQLSPMTFKDPDTGTLFPVWKKYFVDLDAAVPEGKPGLNPGSISRSPNLKVFSLGDYGN